MHERVSSVRLDLFLLGSRTIFKILFGPSDCTQADTRKRVVLSRWLIGKSSQEACLPVNSVPKLEDYVVIGNQLLD